VMAQSLPGVQWVEQDRLLRESDLISLHIPLNKSNHHLLNRERLRMMKTGALVINTSRGAVVDEAALTDALLQGHIGGAALDVFEKEPYEGPLSKLDNVVLTAHIAASARASRYLMELGAAEDCIRALQGEIPKHDALEESGEL
jgi:D-3-phosphoglycerate dehydrogenase / 2-oxoglutarate reductase